MGRPSWCKYIRIKYLSCSKWKLRCGLDSKKIDSNEF